MVSYRITNYYIVGEAIAKQETMNIVDAYHHPLFNRKVDIETSLPLHVRPIIGPKGNTIACLEIINKRGIVGRALMRKVHLDSIDSELVELFEKMFKALLLSKFSHLF